MTFLTKHATLFRAVALTVVGAGGVVAILGSETVNFGTPDEFFTMNYEIRTDPSPATVLSDVSSGARTVASYTTPGRCELEADFQTGSNWPTFQFNGQPGQSGTNIVITGTNLSTRIPPTSECRDLTDIIITIGNSGTVLNIGQPVNVLAATLVANGAGLPTDAAFSTAAGFFQGELSAVNSSTNYKTGEYSFIGIGPNGLLIYAYGTFGIH